MQDRETARRWVGVLLAVAVVLLVWFGAAIVRIENERYALALGMCRNDVTKMADLGCLDRTQTRTHWLWHLYYALRG